jgi:ribosomal protein S18 acetylase RimI-like enzyme
MKIKILTQEDWQIWKSIRLEALKNSPENFGSSYEEERNWPDSDFQNGLTKSDIFGVFLDNKLVSCAGFYSLNSAKTKHRGVIWGMYTKTEYRKQGIASALIQTIMKHAKSRVTQLHLTCASSNFGAMALYQKQGFKIYGTEPQALKIEDTFFDEHLMVFIWTKEMAEP